jgi:histidine triad (HIT) family protein
MLAFHDINPSAPVHFMIIPKAHVDSLEKCGPEHVPVLGKMLSIAARLAREQGSPEASAPSSTPGGSGDRTCIIFISTSSAVPTLWGA